MKSAPETPVPARGPQRLRFGPFLLDLERRTLAHAGRRLRLTPKPFETLVHLVENRGRLVTKQELLASVWRGSAVTEGTLVQAVREVRRVLDDDKDAPEYIQTVPREGYRFVGPVSAEARDEPAAPAASRLGGRGLVLAGAGLLGVLLAWRWLAPPSAGLPSLRSDSLQQLTTGPAAVKPTFSPDGRWLAFVSAAPDEPGVFDLFVQPVSGGPARRLTVGADAAGDMPVFSADGRALVFARYRDGGDGSRLPDLWRVALAGGEPELYVADASGAGFSPDGRLVAYTRRDGARAPLCLAPSADPRRCQELAPRGFVPRFSADGLRLAFTTSDPEGGPGEIWVRALAGSGTQARRLAGPPTQMYGLTWLPGEQGLVAAEERAGSFQLWLHPLDARPPVLLTTGVGGYASPSLAPDGSALVFCHTRGTQDLTLARLGQPGSRALSTGEYHLTPRLSPDGRRVASVLSWAGRGEVLRVTEVPSGMARSLAREVSLPTWLDGQQLAWVTRGEHGSSLVRVAAVATGAERELARFEGRLLALHAAGPRLAAVVATADGSQELRVRDLATGAEQLLARGLAYDHPAFSPDGRWLAWSGPLLAGDARSNGVWLAQPGRGQPRRVALDGHGPVWSADGRSLYFSRTLGPAEATGLFRLELASGREQRLRAWRRVPAFDVAGETLVFTPEAGDSQIYSLALARQ